MVNIYFIVAYFYIIIFTFLIFVALNHNYKDSLSNKVMLAASLFWPIAVPIIFVVGTYVTLFER